MANKCIISKNFGRIEGIVGQRKFQELNGMVSRSWQRTQCLSVNRRGGSHLENMSFYFTFGKMKRQSIQCLLWHTNNNPQIARTCFSLVPLCFSVDFMDLFVQNVCERWRSRMKRIQKKNLSYEKTEGPEDEIIGLNAEKIDWLKGMLWGLRVIWRRIKKAKVVQSDGKEKFKDLCYVLG